MSLEGKCCCEKYNSEYVRGFHVSAGLKCRSQVTGQVTGHRPGHRSGYRSQATGQVTGQVTGHGPQVKPQVTHKNNRTLDKTVLD